MLDDRFDFYQDVYIFRILIQFPKAQTILKDIEESQRQFLNDDTVSAVFVSLVLANLEVVFTSFLFPICFSTVTQKFEKYSLLQKQTNAVVQ